MPADQEDDIPVRLDGLQLDESRSWQNAIWTAQRVIWMGCACVILAALAGTTGRGGVLSEATVSAAGATATLPRITRRGAAAQASVTFLRDAHDHRLFLPDAFIARFQVDSITPRPVAELAMQGGTLMIFAADGRGPHRATLHLRATVSAIGRVALLADDAALSSSLVILP